MRSYCRRDQYWLVQLPTRLAGPRGARKLSLGVNKGFVSLKHDDKLRLISHVQSVFNVQPLSLAPKDRRECRRGNMRWLGDGWETA